MKPAWSSRGCLRCVACVGSCPVGALNYTSGVISLDEDSCTGCGICVKVCPMGCFSTEGKE